jgi:hypothetical protein
MVLTDASALLALQAEINIRKGKKLPVFELAFKAEFAVSASSEEGKPETGKLHIFEVYQDDIGEDFEVRPGLVWQPAARSVGAFPSTPRFINSVNAMIRCADSS